MYILYEKGGSIVIDNKSFKNTFCDEKKLKKCSLRIYTYFSFVE